MEHDVKDVLTRLRDLLQRVPTVYGVQRIEELIELDPETDEFWKKLNSNSIWGGAGSLWDIVFSDFDFDSRPEREYRMYKAEFDTLMKQLGDIARAHGNHNPRIDIEWVPLK